jgi:hypothetical protein
MTTVTVPSLILALYENEMRKVVKEVIAAVSEEFQLELDRVTLAVTSRLNFHIEPVPDARSEKIKMKARKKVVVEDMREQCFARIKKQGGAFCQCTRMAASNNDEFCSAHNGQLKWGRIDEDEPLVQARAQAQVKPRAHGSNGRS